MFREADVSGRSEALASISISSPEVSARSDAATDPRLSELRETIPSNNQPNDHSLVSPLQEIDLALAAFAPRNEHLPLKDDGAQPQTAPGKGGAGIFTSQDRQRYERIRDWFHYVEALPAGAQDPHSGLDKVSVYWNSVRGEAIAGNATSLKVLHALVLEQMYKELTAPSRQLVRFNYDAFNDLKTNIADDDRFKLEVQWRAMLGLRGFYNSRLDSSNPLVADVTRLYDPVFALLQNNPGSAEVQRWGSFLLLDVFPRLLPAQQKQLAERFVDNFLQQTDGAQKLFSLRCLPRMQLHVPHLAVWKDLTTKCGEVLARPDSPETKYSVIALAFLGGAGTEAKVSPLLAASSSADTQCAVAWTLGRLRSDRAINSLESAVNQTALSAAAQEMALASIGEYAHTHRTQVERILAQRVADQSQPAAHLRRAAEAIGDKMSGKVSSEPDYYLRSMLPADRHDEYRALRARYIPGLDGLGLNTAQKNIVDRTLIPYMGYVEKLTQLGEQHILINQGSITQPVSQRNMIGARSFDGRLWDTIRGIGSNNGQAVTPAYDLVDGRTNTFAHELMHHIHLKTFTPEQAAKVVDLFKEAVRAKAPLNYYAASNDREYIAVGNEAYDALYLDHNLLFDRCFNSGYDSSNGHTRAELRFKDRKLFDFIEELRSGPPPAPILLPKPQSQGSNTPQ